MSIEPARVGLVAFLLTKKHPVRHLLTYIATGFTISFSVGATVLFVFHRAFVGSEHLRPAPLQVGLGVFALLLSAVLASRIPLGRFGAKSPDPALADPGLDLEASADGSPGADRGATTRVRAFVKGESRWLSGSAGAALAMPSVDYMALLAVIIASGKSPLVQAAALVSFLFLASLASVIPLVSYMIAPARTRVWVQRFNIWIRSRTRRHAAAFVAALGLIFIAIGIAGL